MKQGEYTTHSFLAAVRRKISEGMKTMECGTFKMTEACTPDKIGKIQLNQDASAEGKTVSSPFEADCAAYPTFESGFPTQLKLVFPGRCEDLSIILSTAVGELFGGEALCYYTQSGSSIVLWDLTENADNVLRKVVRDYKSGKIGNLVISSGNIDEYSEKPAQKLKAGAVKNS